MALIKIHKIASIVEIQTYLSSATFIHPNAMTNGVTMELINYHLSTILSANLFGCNVLAYIELATLAYSHIFHEVVLLVR